MDEISAVRFIIDKLIMDNKLDDYYQWFINLYKVWPHERKDNMDIEYLEYTHQAMLLYIRQVNPRIQLDEIYQLQNYYEIEFDDANYYYFCIDRTRHFATSVIIHERFYENLINEILNYNERDSAPTLK